MAFQRISGRWVRISALALSCAALSTACYQFTGGGGFPSNIKSVYIEPFDNRTSRFELESQLFRQMQENLPRSLGLRLGTQQNADAVVRGQIVNYSDQAQNYLPGQQGNVQVLQHQVQITVAVAIIDRANNEILWDSQSVVGRGEYNPNSQTDEVARLKALENIVRQIIDQAQSQW
jgi:hypothetical protein